MHVLIQRCGVFCFKSTQHNLQPNTRMKVAFIYYFEDTQKSAIQAVKIKACISSPPKSQALLLQNLLVCTSPLAFLAVWLPHLPHLLGLQLCTFNSPLPESSTSPRRARTRPHAMLGARLLFQLCGASYRRRAFLASSRLFPHVSGRH